MPAATYIGDDRFELLRRVGRGGMGEVYEARDTQRDARVALKVLQHVDPSGIYRFKREFRALANVAHPNLVTIYELLSFGDQWYLTMELVDGQDILSYVAGDHGRLRDALLQLARGLGAIHAAGMVHRDVKPSNVLVTHEGRVVLLDFGLVGRVRPELFDPEEHDYILGTVAYVAPEQLQRGTVSAAADWYSVGVILYQALTGKPPFAGDTTSVLADKSSLEPPPPRAIVDGVPPDLDRLCEGLLRRDPAARPAAREIFAVLGAAPVTAVAASEQLIGRERHLRTLHAAAERARAGKAVTVWVRGDSGMGKTALTRRFLADVRADPRAVVVEGRCFERETVPYKAFDSLIDELSLELVRLPAEEIEDLLPQHVAALAQLFPVLRRIEAVADAALSEHVPDPVELRRRAVEALRELLINLAVRRPVVLCIDDLQWGDEDSAHILAELTRPADAPAMLLVGCISDATPRDRVAARTRERLMRAAGGDVRELVVGALEPADARRLALSLLGGDGAERDEQADVVAWESGGNPLFIRELTAYLGGGAALARSDGAPQPSVTLEQVLRARFDALPADARRALEIVAAAGAPIELGHIRAAAELGDRTASALTVLRAATLLRGRGTRLQDTVEPYHGRIRDAVLEGMTEAETAERHRRLALALERAAAPDSERLARHWRLAGVPDKAAQHARDAAERATAALAFDQAAQLYHECLDADVLPPEETHAVQAQLADALANAGRGLQAAEAYLAAAETATNKTAATELKRRAAEQLLRSGHVRDGIAVVREVLTAVGLRLASSPRRALASALLQRARLRMRGYRFRARDPSDIEQERLMAIDVTWSAATGLAMVETIHSVDIHARGTLMALSVGDRYRACRALVGEGLILSTAGGTDNRRATEVIRRAQELAAEIRSPMARGLASMAATYNAFLAGRYADVVARAKPTIGQFRNHCVGAWWELTSVRHIMIWSLFFLGRIAELPRRVLPALREAETRGDLYAATMSSTGLLNAAWLAGDEVDQARERLEHAREWWTTPSYTLQHYNQLLGDVHLDLYTGATRAGYDRCLEQWRGLERSLVLRTQQVRLEARWMRGRAALAAGELDDAARQARRMVKEGMPWATPLARLIEATVAYRRGETNRAVSTLAALPDAFAGVDLAVCAAVTRRRHGEIVGGDAGAELVAAANEQLRDAGIANPDAWAEMLAPGFTP